MPLRLLPPAANQVRLGDLVYFLESPREGQANCLIMAHGSLATEHLFQNAPVNLHFFAPHGRTLKNPSIPDLVTKLRHEGASAPPANDVLAGSVYPDMWLSKVIGRGGNPYSYKEISSYQQSPSAIRWAEPHVVLIRHRVFGRSSILLSAALALLRQHKPTITDVYVAACRPHVVDGKISEFDLVPSAAPGRRPVLAGRTRPIRR
jgi:hypothetical protein